jgi:hypothetical protein
MTTRVAAVLGICIVLAAAILALLPFGLSRWSGEVGRYQIVGSSGVNCFVLDTKTGRLWQRFVESTGGPTDWSENTTPWTKPRTNP